MLKRDYIGQELCSVARTLEIIGDRWTWLIIRDAFLGISRFGEFQESLGIAANVLENRLSRLVDEGVCERVAYCERPPRFEYRLTQKGSDLFTALNALRQWGDHYLCEKPMRLLRAKGSETHRSSQCSFPRELPLWRTIRSNSYQGPAFRATSARVQATFPHTCTQR